MSLLSSAVRTVLAMMAFAGAYLFVSSVNSSVLYKNTVLFTVLTGCPIAGIIVLIRRKHVALAVQAASIVAGGTLAGFLFYPRVSYGNPTGDWMISGAAISGVGYLFVRHVANRSREETNPMLLTSEECGDFKPKLRYPNSAGPGCIR